MDKKLLQIFASLLLIISANTGSAQTTLFDYSSAWKYLDNGTNQGTAWTGTGFNDATWASDTGFFGYGDPWITKYMNACGTVTANPSCTNKYITTYFRKVVNIPSTAIYDSVTINVKRDDGVVVYINGVEVMRDPNMPSGTVTYTTTASTALGGVDEYTPITKRIPISYFTNGNNTVAVELHQQSGTSSDLGFNMQMLATPSLTLFDYSSAWKYLDNGSNQGTAWTGTAFSDATWASDTGFFGYGDTWITKLVNACGTVVASPSCTNKYITTYFRKVINIPAPSLFDSVRFNVKRDDGVVVYVNGTEVARDPNMPSGVITYTTVATTALGGVDEYTPITMSVPIAKFTAGNNTIAVEVHQQAGTSSDLGFNMQSIAVAHVAVQPVTLLQGPYLQMGNKTAVSVRWRTNIASKSKVEVGTVLGTYPIVVSDATLKTEHEIRVTGLTPDTKYYYRIGTDTSVTQGDLNNFFVTAPLDTSGRRVTMAIFGDCGRNDATYQTGSLTAYQNFLNAKGMKAADLMLLVGDNAYNNGTDAEFTTDFFNPYSGNILKNHMLFPAPGNHDYDNGNAARQNDHAVPYYSLFSMPTAGECGGVPSGTEAYYSYDWGANVHVLSLDSYGKENGGTTRMSDTLGAQATWIKNDLAANTRKFVIVYFHHPPYSMGSHNSDTDPELIAIRQNLITILERYGVDLVITGHSHDYERSYLLKGHFGTSSTFNKAAHTTDSGSAKYNGSSNSCPYMYPSGKVNHGTVYVLSGSSGASGTTVSGSYPHKALPFSVNDGGMFYLDIKDNRLDAQFIRRDNTIFDQFTIIKDTKVKDTVAVFPGTAVTVNASWPGGYAWNTGATTRSISIIAPTTDTMLTVKDSATHTCITDQHFIDVVCTTPTFTTCPANITASGCNNVVTYSITDTGTPNPALSYAFTGATIASGAGTGSGSTFNTGVTNVTITATNTCGMSSTCNFTVTIDPLPTAATVSGAGTFCASAVLTAANGADGTMYFQGTTSGGTSTAAPANSQTVTATGTYYFRALSTAGCWGPEGSAVVTINPLPSPVTVSGGGTFCGNAPIAASGGAGGTIYFQNMTSGGVATIAPSSSQVVAATGTYYFRSQSSFGCWSAEGSTSVTINPLPTAVTVTGAGTYCGSTSIVASNGGSGTIYFQGNTSGGTSVADAATSKLVNGSGTYYFRARSSAGCWSTEGNVSVVINPLPAVYTITGGGNYCSGDTGVHVGLSASATGFDYQLYRGLVAVGHAAPGTGAALDMGLQTVAGSYSVVSTNSSTGCSSNMTGSAAIGINPLPLKYTVTGGGDYCAGGTGLHIGLSVSNTGFNYQLYRGTATVGLPAAGVGAALDFGLQTTGGTYTIVAVDNITACKNAMTGVASIVVDALPVVYTVTGGGAYCAGASGPHVFLSGSEAGLQYKLYNGTSFAGMLTGTGASIDFGAQTAAGIYTVVAVNPGTMCTSNMIASAAVSINALPAPHTVTGGGSYCTGGTGVHIGLSGSDIGISYQLYNGLTAVGTLIAGNGSALDFGLKTAAGTYTIVAANNATACSATMTGSGMIAVNTLPVIYSVTGGGSYCASGSGVHVKLNGSETGVDYQLYNGTAKVGAAVAGIAGVIDFGFQKTAGTYTVVAANPVTACTSNMSSSATVSVNALPASYSVTGGGSFCADGAGLNVGLSGSQYGMRYQLYNGTATSGSPLDGNKASLDFGVKTIGGTYTVIATDTATACTNSMTGSAAVNVIPVLTPSIYDSVDKGTKVCDGELVTFTIKPSTAGTAPVYSWKLNGADQGVSRNSYILFPKNGDIVTATVTSSATCATPRSVSTSTTMQVDSIVYPSVAITANPGVNSWVGQKVVFTAVPANGGTSPAYQWYINGEPVQGAATNTLIRNNLSDRDSVSCQVIRQDACAQSASSAVIMSIARLATGQLPGSDMDISVLPNPSKGVFTVLGSLGLITDEYVSLEVTDMLGQPVYTNRVTATGGNIKEQIQLKNIANSIYLLNIRSAAGNKVFHIVVEQ